MVSGKERLRLERMFDKMRERMDRQKKIIDRLTLVQIEQSAALLEIANGDLVESGMRRRAQEAVATVERLRSGNGPEEEESGQDPTTDEENDNE